MSTTYHPPPPSPSTPSRRWVRIAIRIGVAVLAIGTLLVIKPEIITGTLETTGAMVRVGALLLAWLVFTLLVRRFVRPPLLRTGLTMVVGLALLTMTVLPYFIDTRADDVLLTSPITPSTSSTQDTPKIDTTPPQPVRVSAGQLTGLAGHRGSGAASIVRTPDGSHVVQLEGYNVSSGITLVLYLVPGTNQEEPGADGINLGKLAENTGNRVVPIPAGTDLSGPQTVLIWCEPFSTPIAAASQASV
ncbi:MAG: DM13 domain-containing protein [Pseudonocardiaceae bacterium]